MYVLNIKSYISSATNQVKYSIYKKKINQLGSGLGGNADIERH